jgi:arylsulfatase A-like enzyme
MPASGPARPPFGAAAAHVFLAAGISTWALYGVEELAWRLRGSASEPLFLLGAVLATAMAAGGSAVLLVRWFSPQTALVASLVVPAALPFAQVLKGLVPDPWGILVALVPGALLALFLGWLSRKRATFPTLVALGVLGLAPWGSSVRAQRGAHRPTRGDLPDVIVLVMDTTRRDHLSLYGYPELTTPHLDAFGREAAVFENAWSVAPWTPSSHGSMLTGLLPGRHGVDGQADPPFPEGLVTLPGVLADAGYATAGFVANPELTAPGWDALFSDYEVPWLRGNNSLTRLANRYRAGSDYTWGMKRATPILLRSARRWWASHPGVPRFLFVNLLDAHRPYAPPPETLRPFLPDVSYAEARKVDQDPVSYHLKPGLSPRDERILNELYNAEITFMDREIGGLLDWLAARRELDHTLVVVTADHGEHVGERGILGHDLFMDPFVLRVPLIVRYPPKVPPGRNARRVQLDGLPGYILHTLGLTPPPTMEASALDGPERDIVRAQYQEPSWFVRRLLERAPALDTRPFRGDWYFVADRRFAYFCATGNAFSRMCALDDMAQDPLWSHDARAEHPDVLAKLQAEADALPSFHEARSSEIDPARAEQLRSLGYVN